MADDGLTIEQRLELLDGGYTAADIDRMEADAGREAGLTPPDEATPSDV